MSWPVDMLARILLALSKLGRRRKPKRATFVNRGVAVETSVVTDRLEADERPLIVGASWNDYVPPAGASPFAPRPAAKQREVTKPRPSVARRRSSFKTRTLLVAGLVALASAAGVFAYFTSSGTGSALASSGTLNPPTAVVATATPGSGTVPISWTPSATSSTAIAPDGYYVLRYSGSTPSAACGTSPTTLTTNTTCNDLAVADGTYTYTVVARYHSWTAESGPSAPVTVVNDNTPPSSNVLSISSAANAFFATPTGTNTLFYKGDVAGSFNLVDAVTDSGSGPASATFPAIATAGWTHANETVTSGTGSAPTITYTSGNAYTWVANPATPSDQTITGTDVANNSSTSSLHFVSDVTAPAGGLLTVNGTPATVGGSSSTSTGGAFSIDLRTDYTEALSTTESGLATSALTRQSATLTANTCGSSGSPTLLIGMPPQNGLASACYRYTLTGTDNVGNTVSISTIVKVDTSPPSTPVLTLSDSGNFAFTTGTTVYYNGTTGAASSFTVTATSTDAQSGIQKINFPTLGTDFAGGGDDSTSPYSANYTWSTSTDSGTKTVIATNNFGATATSTFSLVSDITAPAGGALTVNGTAATVAGSSSVSTSGSPTINTHTNYSETQNATQSGLASGTLVRDQTTLAADGTGTCGTTFTNPTTITGTPSQTLTTGTATATP